MKDTFMPKLITILSGLAAVFYLWNIYGITIGAFAPGNTIKYYICYGLSQTMMIFGIVMWRRVVKSKKEE